MAGQLAAGTARNIEPLHKTAHIPFMTSQTPVHDFIHPRVAALIAEARANGITKEIAVAVLIDIVTAPEFDTAAPDPRDDSAPHADYDRPPGFPVLVNGTVPVNAPSIGVQAEDDFIRPLTFRD